MSIHIGDIGTVFIVTLTRDGATFDVSTASVKQLVFITSSNIARVKDAAFTTNGTDGKIQYTTIAGDLDTVGVMRVQAIVTVGAGTWRSDIMMTDIDGNLA